MDLGQVGVAVNEERRQDGAGDQGEELVGLGHGQAVRKPDRTSVKTACRTRHRWRATLDWGHGHSVLLGAREVSDLVPRTCRHQS